MCAKHYAKHVSVRPRPRQAPPVPQLQGCPLQAGSSNRPWGGEKEGALVASRGFTAIGRQGRGLGDPAAECAREWRPPRISAVTLGVRSRVRRACSSRRHPSIHPLARSLSRLATLLGVCGEPADCWPLQGLGGAADQTQVVGGRAGRGRPGRGPGRPRPWGRHWGAGGVPGTAGGPGPRLQAERCRQFGGVGRPCRHPAAGDRCMGKRLTSGHSVGTLWHFHLVCTEKTQKQKHRPACPGTWASVEARSPWVLLKWGREGVFGGLSLHRWHPPKLGQTQVRPGRGAHPWSPLGVEPVRGPWGAPLPTSSCWKEGEPPAWGGGFAAAAGSLGVRLGERAAGPAWMPPPLGPNQPLLAGPELAFPGAQVAPEARPPARSVSKCTCAAGLTQAAPV